MSSLTPKQLNAAIASRKKELGELEKRVQQKRESVSVLTERASVIHAENTAIEFSIDTENATAKLLDTQLSAIKNHCDSMDAAVKLATEEHNKELMESRDSCSRLHSLRNENIASYYGDLFTRMRNLSVHVTSDQQKLVNKELADMEEKLEAAVAGVACVEESVREVEEEAAQLKDESYGLCAGVKKWATKELRAVNRATSKKYMAARFEYRYS